MILVLVLVITVAVGGGGGGSVHCEAGNDHRVRFLAPRIVGWHLGEKRFLRRFPLGLCQVLGRTQHIPVVYGFHGVSFPKNCGATAKNEGLPLTALSLHSFIEDNEIGSISKNALRGLRSLTHLYVPPRPHPSTAPAHPGRHPTPHHPEHRLSS